MIESAISSKGRTTLPKPVRPGNRVRYVILDHEVRIIPARPVRRLFRASKHDGPPATLQDVQRAVTEGACGE